MNIYAVILLDADVDAEKTVNILHEQDPSFYDHYASRGVYFVRFSGAAQQLAERLGFANEHGAQRGIVIGVGQYFGYANRDLWNWMDSP